MTKTRRLELRTDEDTEKLITDAAALLHVSKTAFVEDAVRAAARRVIARSDVTLIDPAVFDSMMTALDRPDESTGLAELAKLPKLIDR
ncbi:type II toxin -antitoxin system TacA 1-like antitoxin [Jatrophihabitans sp. DSM 45814]